MAGPGPLEYGGPDEAVHASFDPPPRRRQVGSSTVALLWWVVPPVVLAGSLLGIYGIVHRWVHAVTHESLRARRDSDSTPR